MMLKHLLGAVSIAALVVASAAAAQDTTLTSASGSGAEANSGSISGASSDGNQQAQGQTQSADNRGIGTSEANSNSASGAVSGSESHSGAISDQGQTQTQGQMATNNQGVEVSNTFNNTPLRRTYVGTNTPVALAASSSFSSDYCGGTASAGASVAPIGVTLGGAKPVMDESCQYLRRAEKFGMAGANYWNMQQPEQALKLMSLMVWSICMADVRNETPTPTEQACEQMALLGPANTPPAPPAVPIALPPTPQVTPEYVAPNADVSPNPDEEILHTPRGDADDGKDDTPLASADPATANLPTFAASVPRTP